MKKIFIYFIILIIGGGIGYFISTYIGNSGKTTAETLIETVEKIERKVVKDTVFIKKIVPIKTIADSTELNNDGYSDSLNLVITNEDSNLDESQGAFDSSVDYEDTTEYDIIGDKLLSQRTVTLTPVPVDSTDVSSLLDLKSLSFAQKMTIEFWKSPLNITGYELSRNKLKLFGFNPNETIGLRLSENGEQLFLNTETMSIVLRKSKNFQTLTLK